MRKILLSLFVINILLSFFIFYDLENSSINQKISRCGEEESYTLMIDKEINNKDRKSTIMSIQNTIEKYQGDIVFKVFHNAPGQEQNFTKYVFFKDSDQLFQNIRTKGLILNNYDRSNSYLSSYENNSNSVTNRVGEILVLNPKYKYKIAALENLKHEKYVLSGYYTFNLDRDKITSFITELQDELQVDVNRIGNMNNNRMFIPPILKLIPMIIVFLLSILVVVFDLISKYKDIGVKKINGYSNIKLKSEYYKEIVKLYITSSAISYLILGILYIKFNNILYFELVFRSLIYSFILLLFISLILLIPLSFIKRIKISSAIKNMKPVEVIKKFSIGFKIIFTAILIGLFIFSLKLYIPVYNFYSENLKKWEDAIDYAHVSLSYDNQDEDFDEMIWRLVQNKKLFVYANQEGGIQILVSNEKYKSEENDPRLRELDDVVSNGIGVNDNYLEKNPIYDVRGKKVVIDKNAEVNYVLIPEKYAYLEKDIIYTLENNYYSLHDMPKQAYESRRKEQQIAHELAPEYFNKEFDTFKVIIIKNGQGCFTYDLFKYTESNNTVFDRMITVSTNRTDLYDDISTNYGYMIKVNNHEEPFLSISEKVDELGLSAYYNQAYSAYSNVAGQVNMYLGVLSQIAVIFGIAGITIAILIAYSIMIYMEKEKMDLSIKLLNGYSFIGRHGKKLLRTILFYIFFLPSFIFVRGNTTETRALALLLVVIVILDLLLTYIFISIYEKRNIKDILKGN